MSIRKKMQSMIRPTSFMGLLVYNLYYNIFSFHKQLYIFLPQKDAYVGYLFRYRKKNLKFRLSGKSSIVFVYELFIKNIYSNNLSINKGDYVLDIGANSGLFSIQASEKVGNTGKVICFEPSKENLINLKKNLQMNHINNVIIIEKGTYFEKKTLNFYLHKEDFCNSIYKEEHSKDQIKGVVSINVDTVENLLQESFINKKKIKFIKIDNEGAELDTLNGMKSILKLEDISVLIPDLKKSDDIYFPILNILKKNKFKVFKKSLPSIHAKK